VAARIFFLAALNNLSISPPDPMRGNFGGARRPTQGHGAPRPGLPANHFFKK
jgi:hypothetical protein